MRLAGAGALARCLLGLGLAFAVFGAARAEVRACASNIQYPPFFQFSSNGAAQKGIALDLLTRYSRQFKSPLKVQVLPWRRCLKMAELGIVDIVINVPTAQIDSEPFLVTEAYAQLETAYYVSREHWPDGIAIRNLQDLRSYRICGLSGITYDGYGLRDYPIDSGTTNLVALVEKLHKGRCDIFLEKRQVIAGLSEIDNELKRIFSSPDLIATTLPEDSPIGLHFAVSRKSAASEQILAALNEVIAAQDAKPAPKPGKRKTIHK